MYYNITAIKIGRYTINRKRQNDREVNQMKVKDTGAGPVTNRRISDSSSKSGSSLSPGYSSGGQHCVVIVYKMLDDMLRSL